MHSYLEWLKIISIVQIKLCYCLSCSCCHQVQMAPDVIQLDPVVSGNAFTPKDVVGGDQPTVW